MTPAVFRSQSFLLMLFIVIFVQLNLCLICSFPVTKRSFCCYLCFPGYNNRTLFAVNVSTNCRDSVTSPPPLIPFSPSPPIPFSPSPPPHTHLSLPLSVLTTRIGISTIPDPLYVVYTRSFFFVYFQNRFLSPVSYLPSLLVDRRFPLRSSDLTSLRSLTISKGAERGVGGWVGRAQKEEVGGG